MIYSHKSCPLSEFKGYRNRKKKVLVDQARWDEQMPELVLAYMDFCNCRRTGALFEGSVKERHMVSVWTAFGQYPSMKL